MGLIVAVALTGCGTTAAPTATSTTPATTSTTPAATSTTPAATGGQGERPPTCYPATITENSGNGPTYHVQVCDALLKPRPGHEWQLVVDGGPLGNKAVIFGEQIPR
jgi:hypothetical protein